MSSDFMLRVLKRWRAGKNISRSQLIELLNDGYLHEDSDAHVSLTDKGTSLLSTNS